MIDAIKFRELVGALALASAEVMATKGAASVRWARACNERQRAVDELADLLVAHADALLALVEADWSRDIETAPICDNFSGMYCPDCRAVDAAHCSDPVNCGGMKPMRPLPPPLETKP